MSDHSQELTRALWMVLVTKAAESAFMTVDEVLAEIEAGRGEIHISFVVPKKFEQDRGDDK